VAVARRETGTAASPRMKGGKKSPDFAYSVSAGADYVTWSATGDA